MISNYSSKHRYILSCRPHSSPLQQLHHNRHVPTVPRCPLPYWRCTLIVYGCGVLWDPITASMPALWRNSQAPVLERRWWRLVGPGCVVCLDGVGHWMLCSLYYMVPGFSIPYSIQYLLYSLFTIISILSISIMISSQL